MSETYEQYYRINERIEEREARGPIYRRREVMETIRTIKIVVEIDTNKNTEQQEFETMQQLIDWWNARFETNYRDTSDDDIPGEDN